MKRENGIAYPRMDAHTYIEQFYGRSTRTPQASVQRAPVPKQRHTILCAQLPRWRIEVIPNCGQLIRCFTFLGVNIFLSEGLVLACLLHNCHPIFDTHITLVYHIFITGGESNRSYHSVSSISPEDGREPPIFTLALLPTSYFILHTTHHCELLPHQWLPVSVSLYTSFKAKGTRFIPSTRTNFRR